MKNAREKRAKILFFIVKYANLWGFCCRRRLGCLSSLLFHGRCQAKMKYARAGRAARAKILFLLIKYANLWRPVCRRHAIVWKILVACDLKKNCSARYEVWLSFLWGTFLRNYFMVPFKRIFKDCASLTLDPGWARFVNNIQFFLFAKLLSLFYTEIVNASFWCTTTLLWQRKKSANVRTSQLLYLRDKETEGANTSNYQRNVKRMKVSFWRNCDSLSVGKRNAKICCQTSCWGLPP